MSELEESFAFQLKAHQLPEPIREFPFATNGRRWRFDFAWLDEKIAAEIEGGTRINGRHNRHSGFEKDAEKYNYAALNGWKVLRFTGAMVNDGRAVNTLCEAFGRVGSMIMNW